MTKTRQMRKIVVFLTFNFLTESEIKICFKHIKTKICEKNNFYGSIDDFVVFVVLINQ